MNYWANGALATLQFELRRSITVQRLLVALGLSIFPPAMLNVVVRIGFTSGNVISGDAGKYIVFGMVFLVAMVCVLMLLLWATPVVQSEIEGKTWNFIVVRPEGRVASYLGKYMMAVGMSYTVTMLALGGCILVANQYHCLEDPLNTLASLAIIYALACLVYGAIFSFLGSIFVKRGMVVAVGFMIGVEVLLSLVPAVVNKFTMSFHLRTIGVEWIGWFFGFPRADYEINFGKPWPVWQHLLCLGIAWVAALIAGTFVITNRQYISNEEF